MTEQVMDIQDAIKNLRIQMDSMQLHLDSSHEEICKLNRNNQRVEKENQELRKENKELKERLSKYEQPSKDSNNSSTPPSKESLKSGQLPPPNFVLFAPILQIRFHYQP